MDLGSLKAILRILDGIRKSLNKPVKSGVSDYFGRRSGVMSLSCAQYK
jgi:hypothetical protein